MTFVDFCQLWLIFGRLLSTLVDFCRRSGVSCFTPKCQSAICISASERMSNGTFPPVPEQTSRHSAPEKSCAHSISSSGDRDGAEVRAWPESDLGSSGRRRATDEISRFSQDRLTQQKRKEANRHQQMGKTG